MELKNLTCIECPKGCRLTVHLDEQGKVLEVAGNQCPKGDAYGRAEIEHPMRMFTSVVLAHGLALRMVPVRTDHPIPKDKIFEAMARIKFLRITNPVKVGDIIEADFLYLGVNLIAARSVGRIT